MRYSGEHSTWQLDDLPGCSQVCVSHSAFILPQFRGTGLGHKYHETRLKQIDALKYDCAIATVDETNERQKKILTDFKWTRVHTFRSSKTGHLVGIWIRDIGD